MNYHHPSGGAYGQGLPIHDATLQALQNDYQEWGNDLTDLFV